MVNEQDYMMLLKENMAYQQYVIEVESALLKLKTARLGLISQNVTSKEDTSTLEAELPTQCPKKKRPYHRKNTTPVTEPTETMEVINEDLPVSDKPVVKAVPEIGGTVFKNFEEVNLNNIPMNNDGNSVYVNEDKTKRPKAEILNEKEKNLENTKPRKSIFNILNFGK